MKQPIDLARKFLAVTDKDVLDELNPYAVTQRYDLLDDIEALNRERTKEIMNAVRQWAEEQVNGPISS
jgi:hypothetical protein